MARPKVHTDDVRERLLAEASAVVLDKGVARLSLRDLAGRVGTSTTAVYSLFGSKDQLLDALLLDAFMKFGRAQESVRATADPVADVAMLGWAYLEWARAHRSLYRLMFGGSLVGLAPSPETEAAQARAIAPLRRAVERAQAEGRFLDDDSDTVVVSLWAQMHGVVTLEEQGLLEGVDPLAAAYATVRGWLAGSPHVPRSARQHRVGHSVTSDQGRSDAR